MKLTRRHFLQGSATVLSASLVRPQKTYAANDRIQIGFIGCGARAHELIEAVKQHQDAEIVGLVDAYKGRIQRALDRTKHRPKVYKDYREMIADPAIDAVFVVTPDHWHHRMVIDALRAGKDVYCEKPLTYRVEEGVEIVEVAKQTGRVVQVGSQGMSSQIQQKARELVQSGKLGQVTIVRAAYNRNTASGAWVYPIPPDASPETVDWEMFLGPAPRRPFSLERFFRWRCFRDYSGGIPTDLFVHLCTTIHFIMNAKAPAKVVAMGELYRWKDGRDVPDTVNAVLEYPEGFVVNLSATFNNQKTAEGSFQFLGTEGSIDLGYRELTVYPERAYEDNRWIVESWPKELEEAYYRDPKVRQAEMPWTRPPKLVAGTESYTEEGLNSTVVHVGHFLESVRTRQPYWQDALAGYRAAACAHMINRSIETGRVVEWDFQRETIKT